MKKIKFIIMGIKEREFQVKGIENIFNKISEKNVPILRDGLKDQQRRDTTHSSENTGKAPSQKGKLPQNIWVLDRNH